jgi:glycyl-tRNA synthetase beta chain
MSESVLFEVGVEEIPHGILTATLEQWKEKSIEKLSRAGIAYSKLSVSGTPRRLALELENVLEKTEEKMIEKKGPAVKAAFDKEGKPTNALNGFLSSNKLSIKDVQKKSISGNEYVFVYTKEGGKETVSVLPGVFEEILHSLSFPKTMKWGTGEISFVRPIRWMVSLYGNEQIPFHYGSLSSGNLSYGHRILHSGAFSIHNPSDYSYLLKEKNVIVDPFERRRMILDMVEKTAKRLSAKAIMDEKLLDQLTCLTEYPNAAVGEFEEEFLKLPKEVLISEMVEHQKYVPLEGEAGNLINRFIIITNTPPSIMVIKGNERVIRARFADGKFFFDEDRKKKLEDHLPVLSNALYAKGLGSMLEKVERIKKITALIADIISYQDVLKRALRSAHLAKADLATQMVCEFPELQGIIGYYYALHSFEEINVAISVKEHYLPKFSGDQLPSLKEGVLVSLSDRFDNLFALYAKGNYVTGSKDPFALRRQTLGIIRILIEKKIHLDLKKLFDKIVPLYREFISTSEEEFESKVMDFMTTRIKTVLKETDFSYDEIEAGITSLVYDIYDSYLRIKVIHEARKSENFINLAVAFKRIKNIIKGQKIAKLSEKELKEKAEKDLYEIYNKNEKAFLQALEKMDYALCVSILTSFRPFVDQFFDDVMVMDKDEAVKNNRIALLSLIDGLFMKFIDFEKIIVE